MNLILGLGIFFGCLFTGFVLSHGQILALWQPYELLVIGGCAVGSFIVANPVAVIKKTIKGVLSLLGSEKYSKVAFMELFGLLYDISTQLRKYGLLVMEQHIEKPENSDIFKKYPKIISNHAVMDFLIDNLRMVISSSMQSHELEMHLEAELETYHSALEKPIHALTKVSDSMPGFGIVAAVLGIVITMSMIGAEPKLLGEHIAAALVGTFMGILMAYGVLGPMASMLELRSKKEIKYLECIKIFLVCVSAGVTPQLMVEYARKMLYPEDKPTFNEMEIFIKNRPKPSGE